MDVLEPGLRRVGESADPGSGAGGRFQVDSSLTAARALLDLAWAPDLRACTETIERSRFWPLVQSIGVGETASKAI